MSLKVTCFIKINLIDMMCRFLITNKSRSNSKDMSKASKGNKRLSKKEIREQREKVLASKHVEKQPQVDDKMREVISCEIYKMRMISDYTRQFMSEFCNMSLSSLTRFENSGRTSLKVLMLLLGGILLSDKISLCSWKKFVTNCCTKLGFKDSKESFKKKGSKFAAKKVEVLLRIVCRHFGYEIRPWHGSWNREEEDMKV